jgi:hypothetical protein
MCRASGHLTALFTVAVVCLPLAHLRLSTAVNLLAALVELNIRRSLLVGMPSVVRLFFPDQL